MAVHRAANGPLLTANRTPSGQTVPQIMFLGPNFLLSRLQAVRTGPHFLNRRRVATRPNDGQRPTGAASATNRRTGRQLMLTRVSGHHIGVNGHNRPRVNFLRPRTTNFRRRRNTN